jgi:GGDEF domain-containing protein
LPETSLSRAKLVAERIRKRAMATRLNAHQVQFGVTVSIGIAEASVSMSGIDALMGAADQALYQAKAAIAASPGSPRRLPAGRGSDCQSGFYSGTGTSNVFSVTETMQ